MNIFVDSCKLFRLTYNIYVLVIYCKYSRTYWYNIHSSDNFVNLGTVSTSSSFKAIVIRKLYLCRSSEKYFYLYYDHSIYLKCVRPTYYHQPRLYKERRLTAPLGGIGQNKIL